MHRDLDYLAENQFSQILHPMKSSSQNVQIPLDKKNK